MNRDTELAVLTAFTSLVRTDYISLDDLEKLDALYNYYVDYFNKVPLILQEQDNIITGRRGTGKTTLLYRAYVECLNTWNDEYAVSESKCVNLKRVLPIYIDLNKCVILADEALTEGELHNAFLQEVVKSLTEQIGRFWPKETGVSAWLNKIIGSNTANLIHNEIEKLAKFLVLGKPFMVSKQRKVETKDRDKTNTKFEGKFGDRTLQASAALFNENEHMEKASYEAVNVFSVGDFLDSLRRLKSLADISAVVIFVDEFSSLSRQKQRQLSNLIKALLGNKSGIYIKVSAITDNFDVGNILIPRDLTPISLDLSDVIEGADNLSEGMENLKDMTKLILETRLQSFLGDKVTIKDIFHDPNQIIGDLSLSAMGVTRTMGYALQKVWTNTCAKGKFSMSRADVLAGIKSIGLVYLNTYNGAVKSGGLPSYQGEIWGRLISRAQKERQKTDDKAASHFHVLPKREQHLAKLSEYLIVHLLVKARTTKKDTTKRHLYSFDFGICNEFGIGFTSDKNIIRQQRFVYDNELEVYDKDFDISFETTYICKRCQISYTKDQLFLEKLGMYLDRCPRCNQPLTENKPVTNCSDYTEEETKIVGAIFAENNFTGKLARDIADEVGCSSQKVAKFG